MNTGNQLKIFRPGVIGLLMTFMVPLAEARLALPHADSGDHVSYETLLGASVTKPGARLRRELAFRGLGWRMPAGGSLGEAFKAVDLESRILKAVSSQRAGEKADAERLRREARTLLDAQKFLLTGLLEADELRLTKSSQETRVAFEIGDKSVEISFPKTPGVPRDLETLRQIARDRLRELSFLADSRHLQP